MYQGINGHYFDLFCMYTPYVLVSTCDMCEQHQSVTWTRVSCAFGAPQVIRRSREELLDKIAVAYKARALDNDIGH